MNDSSSSSSLLNSVIFLLLLSSILSMGSMALSFTGLFISYCLLFSRSSSLSDSSSSSSSSSPELLLTTDDFSESDSMETLFKFWLTIESSFLGTGESFLGGGLGSAYFTGSQFGSGSFGFSGDFYFSSSIYYGSVIFGTTTGSGVLSSYLSSSLKI